MLEVGGGTAATTSYLVPALKEMIQSYVWTDLAPSFVNAARREFGDRPAMQFQTFDLELDPFLQGLHPQSFDIVIASNVLHATSDLRKTVANARSLLRAGGLLLIAETVEKQPWVDLTVGFTSGWWRFKDRDLRPAYPLISRQTWLDLLSQSGFTAGAYPDHAQGVLAQQCVITAIAQKDPVTSSRRILIVSNEPHVTPTESASLANSLASQANSTGAQVVLTSTKEDALEAVQNFFSPMALAASVIPERSDIYFLAAAELTMSSNNHDPIAWQHEVLGQALRWTQALITQDRVDQCRLWFITCGAGGPEVQSPDGATLAGFARSVQSEYTDAQFLTIDLDPANAGIAGAKLDAAAADLWRLRNLPAGGMLQYSLRRDQLLAPRLATHHLSKPGRDPHLHRADSASTQRLHYSSDAGINGLKLDWEVRQTPVDDEIEIAISATAINFHEVLSAVNCDGKEHLAPGGECAGVVERIGPGVTGFSPGDPVLALGSGLMADFATLNQHRIWRKPSRLAPSGSATVLIPFLTARWSLEHVARLRPRERVLIHAGAGGVGLAAIQEAHRLGATVFATAGSEEKRQFLRSLGIAAVFDSRSTRFAEEVQEATSGRGVDVVLNSLSGDKIDAGLSSLALGGRFLEIGEVGVLTAAEVSAIRPDIAYYPVHLRQALESLLPEVRSVLDAVLADLESGLLQPLPHTSFPLDQASSAFRFMASGRHIGRVLLEPRTNARRNRHDRTLQFRANGAYVVTGGLSGLGKLTVEWLVEHGAGCILAIGRNLPDAGTEAAFGLLRETGAQILCHRCDVSNVFALELAIRSIPVEYPLRGVIHSAGVLADASVAELTSEKLHSVLAAKVAGAWNLHQATLTADLDFFVLYASAAGVLGSRGQANHAAANAYLDALAHYRHGLGLTALSIDWGAWSETGAAVRYGVLDRSKLVGVGPISPQNGLTLLGKLLQSDLTQVLATPVDWPAWAASAKAEAAANRDLLFNLLGQPSGLSEVSTHDSAPSFGAAPKQAAVSPRSPDMQAATKWSDILLAAPQQQQIPRLEALVEERIRAVLAMPATQSIESDRPLQEYGVDSLLSIELRNVLSIEVGQKLPATTLFDYPTLRSLTGWLFRDVLKLDRQTAFVPQSANEVSVPDLISGVSSLSEEEVERLFQQRMAGIRD